MMLRGSGCCCGSLKVIGCKGKLCRGFRSNWKRSVEVTGIDGKTYGLLDVIGDKCELGCSWWIIGGDWN